MAMVQLRLARKTVWGARVSNLVAMMKKDQVKLLKDYADKARKVKLTVEKDKQKAEKMKKAAGVAQDLNGLSEHADAAMKKIPAGKPCLENLSAAAQLPVSLAAAQPGICSKCRWQSGCFR